MTSPTTDRVKGKVGLDRRGGNSNGRTHGALAQSRVFLGQGSTISDYSDATTHDRYHPNNDPAGFGSVPVVRHAHTHAHGLEGCSGSGMGGMALESRPDGKRGEFAFSVYDMHCCGQCMMESMRLLFCFFLAQTLTEVVCCAERCSPLIALVVFVSRRPVRVQVQAGRKIRDWIQWTSWGIVGPSHSVSEWQGPVVTQSPTTQDYL